jgi:hypothetical protein
VECHEFSEDALELSVPAGLRELSAPLDSLIEFLGIDGDLVEVAASASAPLKEGPSQKELATWVRGLPANEKENLLIDFLSESGERSRLELLQRFQRENAVAASHCVIERRTVKDLLTAARVRADERAKQLSAKRAADAARKKAKDEADRTVYLEGLAKREKVVWKQVEAYIQKRQPKDYERAVILLVDLYDLAVRQGDETGFQLTMEELRQTHAAKGAFLRRLAKANLLGEAFKSSLSAKK